MDLDIYGYNTSNVPIHGFIRFLSRIIFLLILREGYVGCHRYLIVPPIFLVFVLLIVLSSFSTIRRSADSQRGRDTQKPEHPSTVVTIRSSASS